jgi:hypothetical protein
LIVLDEGLTQNLMAGPVTASIVGVGEAPYGRYVDLDGFIHNIQLIEPVDDLEGLIKTAFMSRVK